VKRLLLLTLLLVLVLTGTIMAACGGGGEEKRGTPTPTPLPTKEWNLEDIQVDGSTVTVSVRVYAGIDLWATLDGRRSDEVTFDLPIIKYVFQNVTSGTHTVEIQDVIGHYEMRKVAIEFPTPTPTPPVVYSVPELQYQLISKFGNVFYCDPDIYPVARPEQEEKNALDQFPIIRANEAEFSAIVEQLGLPNKAEYTGEEKLQIYREHKKLRLAVQMTALGDAYQFILRVGEGQGVCIEGTITPSGEMTVQKREPSFNTCPICLAEGTIIDTPNGPISVEQLRKGMAVWTVDGSGKRVAAEVVETAVTPVLPSFEVVMVRLNDGRNVTASPSHPTAEGRVLGDYRLGDTLDGGLVVAVEHVVYDSNATYDILPSGTTRLYRANGVLLRSTLTLNHRDVTSRPVVEPN